MAVRASRTSSSLNGLMIAITIFMGPIPAWAQARRDRAFSTEFHHADKFTTRAQPAPIESNAVPDRSCSLTDYERGPFRALPESAGPVLFGRAQSLAMPAQNEGMTDSRHNSAHSQGRKTVFGCGVLLQRDAIPIAAEALWPEATGYENLEFRVRRCRFRRSGSARRDRSASQKSCRRRSGRCARSR